MQAQLHPHLLLSNPFDVPHRLGLVQAIETIASRQCLASCMKTICAAPGSYTSSQVAASHAAMPECVASPKAQWEDQTPVQSDPAKVHGVLLLGQEAWKKTMLADPGCTTKEDLHGRLFSGRLGPTRFLQACNWDASQAPVRTLASEGSWPIARIQEML